MSLKLLCCKTKVLRAWIILILYLSAGLIGLTFFNMNVDVTHLIIATMITTFQVFNTFLIFLGTVKINPK
jgi:hypothetical protein